MKKFLLLAVVFFFTVSSPATAAIVYSGSQNIIVTPGDVVSIDIAGSSGPWDDFTVQMWEHFAMMSGSGMSSVFGGTSLSIFSSSMGPVVGDVFPNVTNLTSGTPIGMGSSWSDNFLLTEGIQDLSGGIWTGGNFGPDGGYIGLQMFNTDPLVGGHFYGWLHMASQTEIGVFEFSHTAIFDGWAYDDSGAAIAAGDTGLPVIPVPSALILGTLGTGLVTWLRRRKAI